MPFIETDLVKFIVLVIPGILGMWVYKPFVYRSDDLEHEKHDITIALIFGLCGYAAAWATSYVWQPAHQTWVSLIISAVTSVVIATVVGIFSRELGRLANKPAALHSKLRNLPVDHPGGRAVNAFFTDFFDKMPDRSEYRVIAKVYRVGEPDKAVIGPLLVKSDKYDEILIDSYPPLESDFLEKNRAQISIWARAVNTDSGTVTELAAFYEKKLNELFEGKYELI